MNRSESQALELYIGRLLLEADGGAKRAFNEYSEDLSHDNIEDCYDGEKAVYNLLEGLAYKEAVTEIFKDYLDEEDRINLYKYGILEAIEDYICDKFDEEFAYMALAMMIAKEYPNLKEYAKRTAEVEWEWNIWAGMADRRLFDVKDIYKLEDKIENILNVYKEINTYEEFFEIKLDREDFDNAVINVICSGTDISLPRDESLIKRLPNLVYEAILERKYSDISEEAEQDERDEI